ncbi:bifunctional diguanylate cyclase/phosphodiesterase [Caenispirillum bisanense]|uniref:PAS domain S-box-containing protein/diguanylate cyclase (GGDEF) domain-containing protein n=1 Tax=Caenispirillum bisanense TaxID=414052 RepID=A0A286G6K1_9PROT|nr:bifunctional diguanylate cyclase/phosphodiesterase [Caenispirillum bisanense]SOD91125.1 PAS domain S-box-containing protein/diguanylate cyclase (GGDEF) domain-containing protein [Caenispirillum bisanense]
MLDATADRHPLPARITRSLLDHLPDGVAVLAQGRIVFANAAFATLAGRPVIRLLGGSLDELLGDDLDLTADALAHDRDDRILAFALAGRTLTLHVRRLSDTHACALLTDISEQQAVEQALREAERRWRGIFENAVEGIYQSTAQGGYIQVNPALARIYGYDGPRELMDGLTDIAGQLYVDPQARDRFKALMERAGMVREFEAQIRRKDGEVIWITENARCVRDDHGRLMYYEGTVEDITARKQAEEEIRMLAKVFESVAEGILLIDDAQVVRAVNPAFTAMTGYAAEDLVGRPAHLLAPGFHEKNLEREMWSAAAEQGLWRGEVWAERKDDRPFLMDLSVTTVRDERGAILRYVAAATDITRRKGDEERIRFQANYDQLTRLPNRHLITDRLEQAILRARRTGTRVCVLFLDLDRFKYVNDSYGHAAGDELLKLTARRLRHCVRMSDAVGRLGGDEFLIVLPDCGEGNIGSYIAEKVLYSMSEPFSIVGRELFCVPSIGITYWPQDGDDAAALIRHADVAMYHAKRGGERRYAAFEPHMAQRSLAVLTMENDLRVAVARNEFELHLQPKVDAATQAVVGAEALIRWQHPQLGLVSPMQFIPLAEESGLIMPMGRWILREACRLMVQWRAQGIAPASISVNVSPRQFGDQGLLATVAQTLEETGLPPQCLDLEITETVMSGDVERVVATLEAIKAMGVSVSVDDFGTGYSSLNYLKTFPIDTLKIDQTFVRDLLASSGKDAAICSTIITLARNLGFSTVAEGVETAEHAAALRAMGCDMLQGYWISRPVPAEAFERFLRERAAPAARLPAAGVGG